MFCFSGIGAEERQHHPIYHHGKASTVAGLQYQQKKSPGDAGAERLRKNASSLASEARLSHSGAPSMATKRAPSEADAPLLAAVFRRYYISNRPPHGFGGASYVLCSLFRVTPRPVPTSRPELAEFLNRQRWRRAAPFEFGSCRISGIPLRGTRLASTARRVSSVVRNRTNFRVDEKGALGIESFFGDGEGLTLRRAKCPVTPKSVAYAR
jgi:hypothetical protein